MISIVKHRYSRKSNKRRRLVKEMKTHIYIYNIKLHSAINCTKKVHNFFSHIQQRVWNIWYRPMTNHNQKTLKTLNRFMSVTKYYLMHSFKKYFTWNYHISLLVNIKEMSYKISITKNILRLLLNKDENCCF